MLFSFPFITYIFICSISVPIYLIYSMLTKKYVSPLNVSPQIIDNTVFINGLMGWSNNESINHFISYWDNYLPSNIKTATVGVASSYFQRSWEVVGSILGFTNIHYGLLYSNKYKLKSIRNPFPKPLKREWNNYNPLNFVGHSAGCATILTLSILLKKHKENINKLIPFMIFFKENKQLNDIISLINNSKNSNYEEKWDNLFNSCFPNSPTEIINTFNIEFDTLELRKSFLIEFEKCFCDSNDPEPFSFFYDDLFYIVNDLSPECIRKAVFVSAPFKGCSYICSSGVNYDPTKGVVTGFKKYSQAYFLMLLIWSIHKIIPINVYTTYLEAYESFDHFLNTNQNLAIDFVCPNSTKLVKRFINAGIKINWLTVVSCNSIDVYDYNRKSPEKLNKLLSPFSNFFYLFAFMFFGAGTKLDYYDVFHGKLDPLDWITSVTDTDGVVDYESQVYLDTLTEHKKIHPIILDADHINSVGILNRSFTVRKIWENILDFISS